MERDHSVEDSHSRNNTCINVLKDERGPVSPLSMMRSKHNDGMLSSLVASITANSMSYIP